MKPLCIRRRRKSDRSGRAMVEAALVLPMFFLFLMGIFEYGRFLMITQVVTNAAREGGNYAIAHTQPVVISNVTYNNNTSDVTAVINTALAGQSLSSQVISVFLSDSTGTNLGTWTSASIGQSVGVKITGNYPVLLSSLLHMPVTIPVSATVVMRSESN